MRIAVNMVPEIAATARGLASPVASIAPPAASAAPEATALRCPGASPSDSKNCPVPSKPFPPNHPKSFWVLAAP